MPAAEAREIRIQKVLDHGAGPVAGDPGRLQQVIWNLLSNAVKFTPKGGRVQILLERVNSHIEISVSDTGQGIRPEFLPHVFDRFRQADGSTTRRHGGLGLGLSIVRQLVELHGGSVRAKSPGEGQGATFIVALPLAIVRELPPDKVPPKPAPDVEHRCAALLDGVNVLVVDDEPDALRLMERILTGCDALVRAVSSVDAALRAVGEDRPDVLISDIGMPEKDGYDLIREIRGRNYSARDLPAVALTAFARSEDRRRAMLAGFQVHLAKPVDPEELVAVVASLVGRTGRDDR
jgi:CheY-like chemotaxis protein